NSYVVLPESPTSSLKIPLDRGKWKRLDEGVYEDFYEVPCKSNRTCMQEQFRTLKLDTKIDFAAESASFIQMHLRGT
ncbi:Metabotropic glutamate receptor, partial [Caligus rogercresseyi]